MVNSNGPSSFINKELREAYLSTDYDVIGPKPFTLKIGEFSRGLEKLYIEKNVNSAGFLTAWNPHSKLTSLRDNEIAQRQLSMRLETVSVMVLPGVGVNPADTWPGEKSLLALGVSKELSVEIGKEFKQNAVVWIGNKCVPELIFCDAKHSRNNSDK